MNPDHVRRSGFVGPDLGLNCLQKVSADDKSASKGNVRIFIVCNEISHFQN